mgnify:CR=1 FL=1
MFFTICMEGSYDFRVEEGGGDVGTSIELDLKDKDSPSMVENEHILYQKRTYQPSLLKKKRKHGFLARLKDKDGRKILSRRRLKGRKNCWILDIGQVICKIVHNISKKHFFLRFYLVLST